MCVIVYFVRGLSGRRGAWEEEAGPVFGGRGFLGGTDGRAGLGMSPTFVSSPTHKHTHTHTHKNVKVHTQTNTHTRTFSHGRIHTHTQTTNTHTHRHRRTNTDTLTGLMKMNVYAIHQHELQYTHVDTPNYHKHRIILAHTRTTMMLVSTYENTNKLKKC